MPCPAGGAGPASKAWFNKSTMAGFKFSRNLSETKTNTKIIIKIIEDEEKKNKTTKKIKLDKKMTKKLKEKNVR